MRTILLVEDRDACRVTTKWFFSYSGYSVECARSAEHALEIFHPGVHDVVITDNQMSGMSGAEMAQVIKRISPSTPVVMYTCSPPEVRSCIDVVVPRPSHLLLLKTAVDEAFRSREPVPFCN